MSNLSPAFIEMCVVGQFILRSFDCVLCFSCCNFQGLSKPSFWKKMYFIFNLQSVSKLSVQDVMTEDLPVSLQWLYHWCIRVNWWGAFEPHVLGKERGHSGGVSKQIKSSDIGV